MKNLENKAKKSLWNELKTSLKIGIPIGVLVGTLMVPVNSNVYGYFSTKNFINKLPSDRQKEMVAESNKEVYQNANIFLKACWFGDYLAANKYLKNNQ